MLNIFEIEKLFKQNEFNKLFEYCKKWFVRIDEVSWRLRTNRITEGIDIKKALTILTGIRMTILPIYGLSLVYANNREEKVIERLRKEAKEEKKDFKPMTAKKQAKLEVQIERKFKILLEKYVESCEGGISSCQSLLGYMKKVFGSD